MSFFREKTSADADIRAIPESPRFLVSKDRYEEARAILIKYHAEGDEDSELVAAEMAQIRATIETELENKKMGWMQFFTSAANRKRAVLALCIGVFAQWSGNNPLSFYLKKILDQVGITDRREQNIINLGMTCWSLCTGLFSALIVRKFRRRSTFLTSISGMFCVYIALTVASSQYAKNGTKGAGIATLTAIFAYNPFYNLAFNALTYTYLVEIFPFTIRPKGITMQQFWGRLATFINTFVNPIGLDTIGWKYYIWYCVWLIVELIVVYIIYPETSNRSLEELAFSKHPPPVHHLIQITDAFPSVRGPGHARPRQREGGKGIRSASGAHIDPGGRQGGCREGLKPGVLEVYVCCFFCCWMIMNTGFSIPIDVSYHGDVNICVTLLQNRVNLVKSI